MILVKKSIFTLFILFWCGFVVAQNENLQTRIKKAEKISETNYDSAFTIATEIIKECIKQNKNYELAQAYNLAGFCRYFKSNYPSALEYYQKSQKIAEQYQYKDVLLSLHNHLGTFYKKQNLLKEALREFKEGSAVAEELKDSINIASFKNDMGLVYELDNKTDRKSTRLNSSHIQKSRMPSSA